jgi:hypothetical protein
MEYFSSQVMLAAAKDYIKAGLAYDISDFAMTADVDPAWELEVVCAYIDKQLNLALLKDYKVVYPRMPEIK